MQTKTQYLIKLGARINKLRTDKSISLDDIADDSFIEKPNIVRIEKGRTNHTAWTLYIIASALDVPVCDLVNFE